jgi:pimeloyl-ACP methyl ester carboxylesterase
LNQTNGFGRDVPDCHRIAGLVNQAAPGAEHVVLPGLGHMASMEDPALFNATVLDFLARSSSG